MPTITLAYETEAERWILDQAAAYVAELRRVGVAAPPGTVLAACEEVALASGRRLVRDRRAAALQDRVSSH